MIVNKSSSILCGLLVGALFGSGYYSLAPKILPKFSELGQSGLKTQMKAFALSSIVQAIFLSKNIPPADRSLSKKSLETLFPYLLIGGAAHYFHRNCLKANIIGSIILGSAQLSTKWLTYKVYTHPRNPVIPNPVIPENVPNNIRNRPLPVLPTDTAGTSQAPENIGAGAPRQPYSHTIRNRPPLALPTDTAGTSQAPENIGAGGPRQPYSHTNRSPIIPNTPVNSSNIDYGCVYDD